MKTTVLTLALLLVSTVIYSQNKLVNEKYCEKFTKKLTKQLQTRVNDDEMSLDDAETHLAMVKGTCKAAILDRMNKDDYEALFQMVEAADCRDILDGVITSMPNYTSAERRTVSHKVEVMCRDAVLKGETMLILMYNVNVELQKVGVK